MTLQPLRPFPRTALLPARPPGSSVPYVGDAV
jgi:hypothetical protein